MLDAAERSWSDRVWVGIAATCAEVRRLVADAAVPVVADADALFALGDGSTDAPSVVGWRPTGGSHPS